MELDRGTPEQHPHPQRVDDDRSGQSHYALDLGAVYGAAEVRYDQFGLLIDFIHAPAKAGISTANVLFSGGTRNPTLDTGTAVFLYRALQWPDQYVDTGLGVRAWGFDGSLALNQGLLLPATVSSGGSWADPLLAARYHRDLGNGYSATVYGDIGGFGLGAHVDWQLVGTIDYLPAESDTGMFGGNSNWRGPIWMPVNVLIIRGLMHYYLYHGDNFKIECPTGSGRLMNLFEVAAEIAQRLGRIFMRDESGHRPVFGGAEKFQTDPEWCNHLLFCEYFHGDNGAGLGASHQTGWTGCVASLIDLFGKLDAQTYLRSGRMAEASSR